jgi:DNA polymerase family A
VTADLPFKQIWCADFEFVPKSGEHPDVVCLCAYEMRSGQTIRLWRDQLGTVPPYRMDAGALFVCFVANAELACHLALNWQLPVNVLDLSPEFRCIVNGRHVPEGKGLLGALAYYKIPSIGGKRKAAMQNRVIAGWPFSVEEREQILDYCLEDTVALAALLPKILPKIDLPTALYRGASVAAAALMEHRGVPIDMNIFSQLQDKRTWAAVRDAMVPAIDAQYAVYTKDANGDWVFSSERFEAYLARNNIDWPRLETGKLSLRRKTFEDMSKGYPALEDLRQLRHARDKMRKIKLAVGADGRNRTVLWPFKAKTSRTQPKAAEWIFSPAVWLRSLIKPGPGMAVAYVDYSSMEFLIAAALSADPIMLELYASGDPYLGFARRVGAVPASATKASHKAERDIYKVMLLASQYGMAAATLAARLGTSLFEAHELLYQHRTLFAQYWRWSDDWVARALDTGIMRTVFNWTCRTGITEFNERSIRNWPVQAHGGEILRVACIMAMRRGISVIAPVHDAVLLEAPIDRVEADVELMREIMRRASRVVLNCTAAGEHELRTDVTYVRYPDRYVDGRGEEIWGTVIRLLDELNSQPSQARIA